MSLKAKNDTKHIIIKLCIAAVISAILSCVAIRLYAGEFAINGVNFIRGEIFFIVFMFIGCHFVFRIDKMYDFLYRYRWILGLVLMLFLAANKIHGSSIGKFDEYVQPGLGSQYVQPILGKARDIRSDEWLVSTPGKLSTFMSDTPFGKYNSLLRATDTLNELSFAPKMIGSNIFKYFFVIFGKEAGYSFYWYLPVILAFLFSMELFLIISDHDRLISLTGASLAVFSSFFAWWSSPSQFLYVPATLVCFYYFIRSDKLWKKILSAAGFVFAFIGYVIAIYPAWEVPIGYIALVIAFWMIKSNWETIKKFKAVTWIIFAVSIVIGLVLLYGYYSDYLSGYFNAISTTVYPGMRRSAGGPQDGYNSINKIFNYFMQAMFPYHETPNNSEASVFMSFFPIPLIILLYQLIRKKGRSFLHAGLLVLGILFSAYVITGIPMILSEVTLLSYSTPSRLVDILAYLCVIAFVLVMSDKNEYRFLPWPVALVAGGLYSFLCIHICTKYFPDYMNIWYMIAAGLVVGFSVFYMCCNFRKQLKKIACTVIILFSLVSSLSVHPVMHGLDSIYSKPLAKKIMSITETDRGNWVTIGGIVLSSYTVLCGAPTINYTNTYPNLELWNKLDKDGVYNDVYNRFAHVSVELTEEDTSFELVQADYMNLKLSYKDLKTAGISYILSYWELSSNDVVSFEKLYGKAGTYIYKVVYQ